MNSEGYGPGIGTLIGQQWAAGANATAQQAQELKQLREQLRQALAGGLHDAAMAHAAADLTAEIVGELRAEEDGTPHARRLSDPDNVQGRNQRNIELATVHARRMAEGSSQLYTMVRDRIKSSSPLK